MRLPNGYGSVYKLSGKRRKPWAVAVSGDVVIQNGKAVQKRKMIGYAATKKEGLAMLAEYHQDPYSFEVKEVTFRECYEKWSAEHFHTIAKNTVRGYASAFKNSPERFKDAPISQLKLKEVVTALEESPTSSIYNQRRMMMIGVFGWALKHEIVAKNYAKLSDARKQEAKVERHPFTKSEIEWLWAHRDRKGVEALLIGIYTGFRPSEILALTKESINFENWTIIGGGKTDAGKNRIVPIHPDIRELITNYTPWNASYATYRESLVAIGDNLENTHTLHDTRHTFASFAAEYNLNPTIVKLILGHSVKDITERVYTHRGIAQLHEEIAKIQFTDRSRKLAIC